MEVYVALDPSYTRTGISLLKGNSLVILDPVSEQIGKKTFQNHFLAAQYISAKIAANIMRYLEQDDVLYLVSEVPPPVGQYAAGLSILDTYIFCSLKELNQQYAAYAHNPGFIGSVHKVRRYPKAQSVGFAYVILEYFKAFDYSIKLYVDERTRSSRICHDSAESLILLPSLIGAVKNLKKDLLYDHEKLITAFKSLSDRLMSEPFPVDSTLGRH